VVIPAQAGIFLRMKLQPDSPPPPPPPPPPSDGIYVPYWVS